MAKRKTSEEYRTELSKANPNLVLLSDYVNSNTKVIVKDVRCGHAWDVTPSTILNGHGCPKCAGVKKKTHQEFVDELRDINPDIEILSKYVNSNTKIRCKCKICGFEWEATPNALIRGKGCGKCYGLHLSDEDFSNKLHQVHQHINLNSHYRGMNKLAEFICTLDGTIWEDTPKNVIRTKYGCPTCVSKFQSERQIWSNEKYITEIKKNCNYIYPKENYIRWNVPIEHACSKCGYSWKVAPTSVLHNPHCPSCDGSTGERKISSILDEYQIQYECQKKFDDLKNINSLRYDFYLPSFNTLIEYDGQYHYQPIISKESFEKGKMRDELKNDYALEHNIKLIRIPYWEYDNIESILQKQLNI